MKRIMPRGVVRELDEDFPSNLATGSNAGFQNLQTYPLFAENESYWWEQFKKAQTDAERGVAVDALTRILFRQGHNSEQTLFALDGYAQDHRFPFNREEAWRWILKVQSGNPPWEARAELEEIRKEKVHFVSAADFCNWKLPPWKWLVEKLIPEKILCMIGGFAKDGKTTLVSQLIMDCLRGAHFLGLKTTKSRIAYFAVEETARTVCDRLKKMGLRGNEPLLTHCFPLTIDEKVIGEIITKCTREAIDTIIIDTMGSALDLVDENQSAEMSRKMRLLLQLRDAGFTVIAIHHTGKTTNNDPLKSLRGSSSISATIDQLLLLSPGKGNQRKLMVRGGAATSAGARVPCSDASNASIAPGALDPSASILSLKPCSSAICPLSCEHDLS